MASTERYISRECISPTYTNFSHDPARSSLSLDLNFRTNPVKSRRARAHTMHVIRTHSIIIRQP